MAEDVGFEPTERLSPTVFKAAAISHSANLPQMVWMEGFEPPTTCSQNKYATKLHYIQTITYIFGNDIQKLQSTNLINPMI